jgi:predicted dehydrogenase
MPSDTRPHHRQAYAFVGTGHRAEMFFRSLLEQHHEAAWPVALCDTNDVRLAHYRQLLATLVPGSGPVETYPAEKFDTMLSTERPDTVVVTTPDHTHADYVTAALEHGCRVVVEKPLTVDADGCRRIAESAERSDGELVVTFNYRYSPRNEAVRRLLAEGAVGRVTSVVFEWVLDTVHGADYFRRWHREKAHSGGLLVHKASHHFDLVNWWVDDVPEQVYAAGSRAFYGPDGPAATRADEFALDLADTPRLERLYGGPAAQDGYVRNLSVAAPGVDIEDNLAAVVGYRGGAVLSYSLNAHCPWEGYRVAVNGTEGRLELEVVERAEVRSARDVLDPSVTPPSSDRPTGARAPGSRLLLQRHWSAAEEVPVAAGSGAHGGGDDLLLHDVFRGTRPDPFGRRAGYRDGLRSVLVGVAANDSIRTGRPVSIADLGVPRHAYDPNTQEK